MKKRWLSIYAITAMVLLLAACGTTENNKDNNNEANNNTPDPEVIEENDNNEENPEIDDVEKDEEPSEEDTTNKDEPANEEAGENSNEDESKDDEEIVEGTDNFLNNAELTNSDEQDYSIYLLPNYKLTSEEPGKDSLYLEADGSIFMRIETTLAEEGTYDYLLENMQTMLTASSSTGTEPVQLEDEALLPSGEFIENAQAYTVDSAEGPVTGVLFEKNGMVVRLTVFDSLEAEHFHNFISMGETITQKE